MKINIIKKKILPFLFAAVLLLLPFTSYGMTSEDPEYFGTVEYASTFTAGTTMKDSFYYSDEWFLEDPEVQNDALALVSMQLVAAAVNNEEDGTGVRFLKALGFEQTGFTGFDEEDPQGCNFTWGLKTIGTGDDAYTLAVIVIQSHSLDITEKQIGFGQNFLVNGQEITPEHASYAAAADKAAEQIRQMEIGGNVKYWITGQSRGGALAGAIAARLKDDAKSIYSYTFEAPAYVEAASVQNNEQNYSYIHNYICSDDIVTMILPWGMTRYGVEHILNTEETTANLYPMLSRMGSDAAGLVENYDTAYSESLSAGVIQTLLERIPEREDYSVIRTDRFTDEQGDEIEISYSYQDLFVSLVQVIYGNVMEGVSTDRLLDDIDGLLPAVSSLWKAVTQESDADYYEAANSLSAFLEKEGIELPMSQENIYAFLKLAGHLIIDETFVPQADSLTEEEMFDCIAPLIDLFMGKDYLIFSHHFDTLIARLKTLAQEPVMESFDAAMAEPSPGVETAAAAVDAEEAFRDLGFEWLTASAEWKTGDPEFLNDKIYYLAVTFSTVGHSIPEGLEITINGRQPEEPLEISYTDGVTEISGIWKYVFGTPSEVVVSFDMEGHGDVPETLSVERGSRLGYALSPATPDKVSDSDGTFTFGGWYDDKGIFWEDVFADEDLSLHAKWDRKIDRIEISYQIPAIGEEPGTPEVPADALYKISRWYLVTEDWEVVEVVSSSEPLTLEIYLNPVSAEAGFLTAVDKDEAINYTGKVFFNGEETEFSYNEDEFTQEICVEYSFVPSEK